MKVGIFLDKFLNKNNENVSFYIKDGNGYYFHNDKPVNFSIPVGIYYSWVYAFDGIFINLSEYKEIPKYDLDIIFVSLEWHINKIDEIRKVYPNALICAIIKELFSISSLEDRVIFFNKCDRILSMYKHIECAMPYADKFNKFVDWLPCPVDINAYKQKYGKENKKDNILIYLPYHPPRRGKTEEFAKKMSKKYKLDYLKLETSNREDFLDIISKYKYIFNLDPEPQLGQVAIYNAIFNNMNIGGLNDSHKILYPDTATNDLIELESIFTKFLENQNLLNEKIKFANDTVISTYSYESVKDKFLKVLKTSNKKSKSKIITRPSILYQSLTIKSEN